MALGVKIDKLLTVIGATTLSVMVAAFFTQGWLWPLIMGIAGFSLSLYLVIKNKHERLSDILSQIGGSS